MSICVAIVIGVPLSSFVSLSIYFGMGLVTFQFCGEALEMSADVKVTNVIFFLEI